VYGFDLGADVLELRQKHFDLIGKPCQSCVAGIPLGVAAGGGKIVPQAQPLSVIQTGDADGQLVDMIACLAVQKLMRRCFQDFAQAEKQAQLESLLVTLNTRERGYADFYTSSHIIEGQPPSLAGVANSIANHDRHGNRASLRHVQISLLKAQLTPWMSKRFLMTA
jgi:hypothetical protein